MSKIGLVILMILMAGRNYAQEDYFVLMQADDNRPFYVRMEGESKILPSSEQGHLILSPLKEGAYIIKIGFPKKDYPEQQFSFSIHKKDLDWQLKDLGEKGWGLFNLQTLELKMPDEKKDETSQNHLEGVKKDDAFSRLMAGVVSDTAVMYNTYAMEASLKDSPAVSRSAPVVDSPAVAPPGVDSSSGMRVAGTKGEMGTGKDTARMLAILDSVAGTKKTKEVAGPDTLKARADSSSLAVGVDTARMTVGQTLVDQTAVGQTAARQIDIPKTGSSPIIDSVLHKMDSSAMSGSAAPSASVVSGDVFGSAPPSALLPPPSVRPAGVVVKLSERKTAKGIRLVYTDETKGLKADTIVVIIPVDTGMRLVQRPAEAGSPVRSPSRTDTTALASAGADRPPVSSNAPLPPGQKGGGTPARSLFINSDCKNFATDYDVDKLRVKMLETSKDEDRISAARKVFKTKCFTTRQVRALSEVFTSDGQKFRFFETAYPFVSDDHFKELTSLLADPVYNSKFRAMTGQQ